MGLPSAPSSIVKHLTIFYLIFSFFVAFPLRKEPKRDPKRADGVAVEKRRGRGPAFSQPTGPPGCNFVFGVKMGKHAILVVSHGRGYRWTQTNGKNS
jgi:hypothetical protein